MAPETHFDTRSGSFSPLTADEARARREQLVTNGFTVIPGVMPPALLQALRDYTSELFDRVAVPASLRYQGSSHFVSSPRSKQPGTPSSFASHHKVVEEFNDSPLQSRVAELLGLEGLRPRGQNVGSDARLIIISKPPQGLPLYWHQDFREWNSPVAATPWPHQVFFSYYLSDTTPDNGCLRVIPGSHLHWHPLHDALPNAHEPEIQSLEDLDSPIFGDAIGAVDVPVAAGDLVIGDARVLHAARANNTEERRTCVLAWYNCFQFPRPPSWWEHPVPQPVRQANTTTKYRFTRVPNIPWAPRPHDYHKPWGPAYTRVRQTRGTVPSCLKEQADDNDGQRVAAAAEQALADIVSAACSSKGRTELLPTATIEANQEERECPSQPADQDTVTVAAWRKYRAPDNQGDWWYCELDGDWFWEDDPGPWAKYRDPASGQVYWWKSDTKCFGIPSHDLPLAACALT